MKRRSFLRNSVLLSAWPIVAKAQSLVGAFRNHLKSISSDYILPGEAGFSQLKSLFNLAVDKKDPVAILQTDCVGDYQKSFQDALVQQEKWFIRSGGHSFAGFSVGEGILFDSRSFKDFEVHGDEVVLGSGLTLLEAQNLLKPHGLAIPNGTCPVVGLGGFLLGGGHSNKSRTWGLACDRVLAMDVILASGELVTVSPNHKSDLYWALLGGGGGNFAMVKNFRMKAFRSKGSIAFTFHFDGSLAAEIFEFWENHSYDEDPNISVAYFLQARNKKIEKVRVTGHIHDIENEEIGEVFHETRWAQLYNFNPTNYKMSYKTPHEMRPVGQPYPFVGSSQYAEQKIGTQGFTQIRKAIEDHIDGSSIALLIEPFGGEISQSLLENSYPHRHCRYVVELNSTFLRKSQATLYKDNFHRFNQAIDSLFSGRQYVNYCDLKLEDWARRYYAQNLDRLLEIKETYDPDHRFDFGEQSLSSLINT